jgi:hypothetical protein
MSTQEKGEEKFELVIFALLSVVHNRLNYPMGTIAKAFYCKAFYCKEDAPEFFFPTIFAFCKTQMILKTSHIYIYLVSR